MSDMVERMVYTGTQKPWWMANSLTPNSQDGRGNYGGLNAISSAEAIRLAGLEKFRVEKWEAGYWSEPRQQWIRAEGERFLVRTDTGLALGRCTQQYQEYQPSEAFAFLDRFARDGEILYHTAGILDEGRKVWLLAQTPIHWDVKRRSGRIDRHYQFLMSSLDFTGKGSNVMCETNVNVVCANTERAARNGAPVLFKIPHKGDMNARYEAVREALESMYEGAIQTAQEDQELASAPMSRSTFIEFATAIFLGVEQDEAKDEVDAWFAKATDRSKSILRNKVQEATRLFERGIGNEGVSAYDGLQAFTQYFDHFDLSDIKDRVERGRRAAKALTSAWDGDGAEKKARARQRLLRMVKA